MFNIANYLIVLFNSVQQLYPVVIFIFLFFLSPLATVQFRNFCPLFCCIKMKKLKYSELQFFCRFLWVRNLVSDINGRIQSEIVHEERAEGNIWTEEG
jgi:hypothetical protein